MSGCPKIAHPKSMFIVLGTFVKFDNICGQPNNKPIILGKFIPSIYDLGGGLLLALPHYLEFIGNLFYLPSGKHTKNY